MVNIKVDEDNQFMIADMSWTEYLGAFTICCGVCQVKVPLSAIKNVRSVANLWDERRGIRVGSGIPWVFLLGSTWFCSGQDFVAIYGRNAPGVIVELDETQSRYSRWLISSQNPDEIIAEINRNRNALISPPRAI